MPASEKDLRRAASGLVETLVKKDLLVAREAPPALEQRVFAALRKNFREEDEIGREAERILAENLKLSAGMDQRKLLIKIRQKVAQDRGFVL